MYKDKVYLGGPIKITVVIAQYHVFILLSLFSLRILFYAISKDREKDVYRDGMETGKMLKEKLLSSPYVLDYKVVGIDTVGKWSESGHMLNNASARYWFV